MSKDPQKVVRFEVAMALAMTKQWQRRDYAGRAPGRSRKPTVIFGIAAQIVKRIVYSCDVRHHGGAPAEVSAIEAVASAALQAFPEAPAFLIAAGGANEAEAARAALVEAIAVAILGAFEIEPKAFTGLQVIEGNMAIGVPR